MSKGGIGVAVTFIIVIVVLQIYSATCGDLTGRAKDTCDFVLNDFTIAIILVGLAGAYGILKLIWSITG